MVEIIKAIKQVEPASRPRPENSSDRRNSASTKTTGVDVNRSGWVSPQYRSSRRVKLDRKILEANHCIGLLAETPQTQYYKVLRTQIQQYMRDRGWNTLMITSVHRGEGKTLNAINLAAVFAKEYHQTVLLVDADLKCQAVHRRLGYSSQRGLVDYLLGECTLPEIIVWPGVEKFTAISGSRTLAEGTEALSSPRMRELVTEMKQRYKDRYLFFDVPPILGSADAMAFSEFVDGIVVVVQSGRTPMPDIQKALTYLPQQKFIGFVMNRQV
jgi:protein-tyrosine kinase